jgi:hypothetical protein
LTSEGVAIRGPGRAIDSAEIPPASPVGRITGVLDCQWSDPMGRSPARPASAGDEVPLGRKYALSAGFLEITYDSGAKVVLQGPAVYEVESKAGGYLSLGKLCARVEAKKGTGPIGRNGPEAGTDAKRWSSHQLDLSPFLPQGARGERTANQISSPHGTQPTVSLAPGPLSLFSVRTPTAVVIDLGTEFGIEVDRSGTSRAEVFQGKVEVRPTNSRGLTAPGNPAAIRLSENESAVVEPVHGAVVKVSHKADQADSHGFVRRMPRQVPIKLFNTGIGLKEGDLDPHWQLTARSDDPKFTPGPAVVTVVDTRYYLPNNPARSQWISIANGLPAMPRGTYTFRTTFELADAAPGSAVLTGRFLVDNHVNAIRLNGQSVSLPEHGILPPFDQFHTFTVRKGFVAGTNVLEIDVYNHAASSGLGTPMALLVELEGFALRGGHIATETNKFDSTTR